MDGIDITVTMEVQGKEGFKATFEYKDTDMKTVVKVQRALMGGIGGLLTEQEKAIK